MTSDLPFVPCVNVARVPVTINLSRRGRGLTAPVNSPADLVARFTLQQLNSRELTMPQSTSGDGLAIRGYRDPTLESPADIASVAAMLISELQSLWAL